MKLFIFFVALVLVFSLTEAQKPGQCPVNRPGPGVCVLACRNDLHCPGNKKCCGTNCGGMICVDPVIEKPGSCPPLPPNRNVGAYLCAMQCRNDQQCSETRKCCPNTCGGSSCIPPIFY